MQKSGNKSAIFPGDGNRYVRHIGSETAVWINELSFLSAAHSVDECDTNIFF